jgi:hypothetical protein
MSLQPAIVPEAPQCMRALDRANEVRIARAELKRRVFRGELHVADVIRDCPWEAETMRIGELLTCQFRWGWTRCRKMLAQLPMSEQRTLGSMTERQRQTLSALLRAGDTGRPGAQLAGRHLRR